MAIAIKDHQPKSALVASPLATSIVPSIAAERLQLLGVCPSCAIGAQAREDVWRERPGYYAAALALPFALIVLLSRLLRGA